MKEKEMNKTIHLLLYIIFIGPFSITLFLYGFFPLVNYDRTVATVDDIPKYIENVRLKTESLYRPTVERIVIMVIDALRWDFITGPVGKIAMPVTSTVLANSSACLLQAKVQPPTVTMPRIKALTTGTVPSFIDIALNFGSKPVSTDNVLYQAKRYGHKLIFYGDDTWLSLFPNTFEHYDGVTSFLVTDFTEVDNNVTRHVHNKLSNSDEWSIMILHYLGLDHIGHVHGPSHSLIKKKLHEMDGIIASVYKKVQEWNENTNPSLFIICGDHGMKDSGGHGGSTFSETTVPLIAIGGKCSTKHDQPRQIAQIDIAPTLSALLGMPIPFSNLGTVFLDELYDLPISTKLFILYYNTNQVFNYFKTMVNYESEYGYKKYLQAIKLHIAWLNTQTQPNDMTSDIVDSYYAALKGMKQVLMNKMINYDYHVIVMAIFFLCHIICIAIGKQKFERTISTKKIALIVLLNIALWAIIIYIWDSENVTLLSLKDTRTLCLITVIITILYKNCYLLAGIEYSELFRYKNLECETIKGLLLIATIIHAMSLGGSSFVEEEHQTWYFYWVTLLVVLLFNSAKKVVRRTETQSLNLRACIEIFLILVGHRILRHLNSTGDKYAYLPDYAEWLQSQENMLGMTILLGIAIIMLIRIGYLHEDATYKQKSLIFYVTAGICIYLRQMHNNAVMKIPLYPKSTGQKEMQFFWVVLAIYVIYCVYRVILVIKNNRVDFLKSTLLSIIQIWTTISAMVHQPYNVILLPLQIIFSNIIHKIIKQDEIESVNVFIYTWMGQVFYYYQGNSNSLATIDVAAGFVGVQSYMPFVNGVLMTINTYSAPVLASLLLVYYSALLHYQAQEIVTKHSKMYITLRLLPITIYTIIISVQRHHLFVWSVFSPKLLYEAAHTAVICFVVLVILVLVIVQNFINTTRSFSETCKMK